MEGKKRASFWRNKVVQSLLASLLCIVIGLLAGFVVLLVINPAGALNGILTIIKNFFYYPSATARLKYFGSTLVKTAPLLMCSLSVLFAYKVGLFNIGAAGQYVVGAGACLYCALALHLPWYVCLLLAVAAGALLGAVSGVLKACLNVNEVISCIMLNWISLYLVNMLLNNVKEVASPYTMVVNNYSPGSVLPSLGLDKLFSNNYMTLAIPLSVLAAVLIWVLLEKTKLGYELKATGFNKFAARYCGMKERRNVILTMAIAGGLGSRYGLQRHCRRLPGRAPPHRRSFFLLLYPAYHQWGGLSGQVHVLCPNFRFYLRPDHLSVRICALHQAAYRQAGRPSRRRKGPRRSGGGGGGNA